MRHASYIVGLCAGVRVHASCSVGVCAGVRVHASCIVGVCAGVRVHASCIVGMCAGVRVHASCLPPPLQAIYGTPKGVKGEGPLTASTAPAAPNMCPVAPVVSSLDWGALIGLERGGPIVLLAFTGKGSGL